MAGHIGTYPCVRSPVVAGPVIITNSISGAVANREQCPAIPYTPEEYGAEARRAVEEGAAMIHIHARTPDGVPSYEIDDFAAITEAIRAAAGGGVINYSTRANRVPPQKRGAHPPGAQTHHRGPH